MGNIQDYLTSLKGVQSNPGYISSEAAQNQATQNQFKSVATAASTNPLNGFWNFLMDKLKPAPAPVQAPPPTVNSSVDKTPNAPPPAPPAPSFSMPVSDSSTPFSSVTPQHIMSIGDAATRGGTPASFIATPPPTPPKPFGQTQVPGQKQPQTLTQTLSGLSPNKAQTTPDPTKQPFSFQIFQDSSSAPSFLMSTSTAATPDSTPQQQTARVNGAVANLTKNHPLVSTILFGSPQTSGAAMDSQLSNTSKIVANLGISSMLQLPVGGNSASTKDLATKIMGSTLLSHLSLSSNVAASMGPDFATGFGASMLQDGNKENAFVQGSIFSALGAQGKLTMSPAQSTTAQYKFALKNLGDQIPSIKPALATIEKINNIAAKTGGNLNNPAYPITMVPSSMAESGSTVSRTGSGGLDSKIIDYMQTGVETGILSRITNLIADTKIGGGGTSFLEALQNVFGDPFNLRLTGPDIDNIISQRANYIAAGMSSTTATKQAMSAIKMGKAADVRRMGAGDELVEGSMDIVPGGMATTPTTPELTQAWKDLGSPKTPEEMETNFKQVAHTAHPDMPGGSNEAMSALNQAHQLLLKNGLPADLVYGGGTAPVAPAAAPAGGEPATAPGTAPAPEGDTFNAEGQAVAPTEPAAAPTVTQMEQAQLTPGMQMVLEEFDASSAGSRYSTPGMVAGSTESSNDRVYKSSPSTFPSWVPSELRNTKLFDQATKLVTDGKMPKAGTRLATLYDLMVQHAKTYNLHEDLATAQQQVEDGVQQAKSDQSLSLLDTDKVYAALVDDNQVDLGSVINDEPSIMKGIQSKALETQTGKTAVAGEELATGFHDSRTAGEYGSGISEGDKGFTSDVTGQEEEDVTDRRLSEVFESALAKNVKTPTFEAGARPTNEQRAYAKLMGSYANLTPELKTAFDKMVNEATTAGQVEKAATTALRSLVEKSKSALQSGDPAKVAQVVFNQKPNEAFFKAIIDGYKQSDGSRDALANSINAAAGQTNTGVSGTKIANALVKEFGFADVDALKNWLDTKFGDVLDRSNMFEANRAAIMENIQKTVNFERTSPEYSKPEKESFANLGKDVKAPDGTVKTELVPTEDVEQQKGLASTMDLQKQLADKVGSILRQEHLPPNVKGKAIDSELAIIKTYNEGTVWHELSHNIDSLYGITDSLRAKGDDAAAAIAKDLVNNLTAEQRKVYEKGQYLNEGFANLMKSYFNGSTIVSPKALAFTQAAIEDADPEQWAAFQAIRQQSQDVMNAPALARANAAANINEKPAYEMVMDKVKQKGFLASIADAGTNLYRRELNLLGNFADQDKLMNQTGRDSLQWHAMFNGRMKNGISEHIMDSGVPEDVRDITEKNMSAHDITHVTRGLKSIIADIPKGMEDSFRSYMKASQFEEYAKRDVAMGKTPVLPKSYSAENIDAIKAAVEKQFPGAPKLLDEIAQFNRAARKMYVQGGRMTQQDIARLEQTPRFTSLQRQGGFFGNDFKYNKFISTIQKSFRGSEREDIVDPFIGILNDTRAAVAAAVDGRLGSMLYDMATNNENADLRVVTNPATQVAALSPEEVMKTWETFNGPMAPDEKQMVMDSMRANPDLLPKIYRPQGAKDPNVMTVWVDGEAKQIFMKKGMKDWLEAERNRSDAGAVTRIGMLSAKLKRTTSTVLSPAFLITHTLREFYTTLENGERVMDNTYGFSFFKHGVDIFKGMAEFAKGAAKPGASEAYDNAVMYGSIQRTTFGDDAASLGGLMKTNADGTMGFVKSLPQKFYKMMRGAISATDSAGRMAVMSKYNQKDPDDLTAGLKDMVQSGVDWNQRGLSTGELSRLNEVLGFAKAGFLGIEKSVRPLGKPGRMLQTFWPIVAISLATAIANKDNKQYQNLPMSRQLASMNIPLGNGAIATIPYGVNVPMQLAWGLPQMIYFSILNKDPKMAEDFAAQIVGELTKSDIASQGLSAFQAWMPDAIQQLNALTLEPMLNKNLFTGQAIVPTNLAKLDPLYQKESYTSNVPVALADALHKMTGVKVSPMQLDNFLNNSLYGSYAFFSQGIDATLGALGISPNEYKTGIDAADVPMLSRFVHDAYTPSSQYYVSRVFDLYDNSAAEEATLKSLEKTDPSQVAQFKTDNAAALRNYASLKGWYSQYTKTATQYREVEAQPGLDLATRQKTMSNITDGFLTITNQTFDTINMNQ
jgi:hypothetical protein